ncbi:MAG TPA: MarR family transcriptional regulator [Chloroflexota bacterium]
MATTAYRGATQATLPGYSLAQVYRLLRHAMDDALRAYDLTTPQWAALGCMAQNAGISGAELARVHRLTPQTMNTILHNLEQHEMIRREQHPTQGTVLCVFVTDEGHERMTEATQRVEAVQERMLSLLNAEERETLVELLERCMAGLEANGLVETDDLTCAD